MFNLMFKTFVGPVEDDATDGLPAARDGAGHVRQLRQRRHHDAPQAALRHRPDRPLLPQRDHARQLHLPRPRVRADGDGVLLQARHRRGVARPLDRAPLRLVARASASARRTCASASTRRKSSRTTPRAPSTSSTTSPSPGWSELEGIANRTDFDLKAHAAARRQDPHATSTKSERAHRPLRHRAGGRRRPLLPRRALRRLRRGRGARTRSASSCASTRTSRRSRSPCCRSRATRSSSRWRARSTTLLRPHFMTQFDDAQSIGRRYRRQDEIGTPSASRSTSTRSKTTPSPSATATP